MKVLGISCFYHDASAALVVDGEVVAAAAEERFTRKKHDNSFPVKAIEYCLNFQGIAANELDAVVFYEKPIVKLERILSQHLEYFPNSAEVFMETTGFWLKGKLSVKNMLRDEFHYFGPIYYIPHHLSHAASSFFLSGFKKATIVTIDGVGEWTTTAMGLGDRDELRLDKEIVFPHSLGLLYSTLTAYLGFKPNNDEYKVMGLAAYGNPEPYREHFKQLLQLHEDGSFSLEMKYFDYGWSLKRMHSKKLEELFGYPRRKPESKVYRYHKDIAAALQERLEEAVFWLLTKAHETYGVDYLCLSGGVALNSVMNAKIIENTPFKEVFIPPDPGDAGGAMGAALYWARRNGDKPTASGPFSAYLGPGYPWYQVVKALEKKGLYYQYLEREQLLEMVVEWILDQKVVGWFQGRMEWGPRALGNRSILASAANEEMRDIINAKVKHREMFRPFAPVILEEHVPEYFEVNGKLPVSAKWMLMVYPFLDKGKNDVPAVVHVDGSGRLQTISRADNPLYYDLIQRYQKQTGVPILINTSFNVRGEPIVCSPENAIDCFLNTEIDYLVLDQFVVKKLK